MKSVKIVYKCFVKQKNSPEIICVIKYRIERNRLTHQKLKLFNVWNGLLF